ncbi:hypothetical protein LIPSTDRAFT_224484 [Lipomyces starkeyi NRRL Y-11557]|uniref:MULE transposase domain-containing protein n=1 Tax=Lipomyces starkeyi NRRL Y-11557 TaxID=675824 RepID=A0A1E3PVB5_LIPST|nr:hypothetical protein LIPSTDRAFT_224484 [Lipomyces starkeyi NRRL Y-11557]
MKALAEVFPQTFNQICRWHIQQNILKHCRQMFNSMPQFESFMTAIKQLAISDTEKSYSKLRKIFLHKLLVTLKHNGGMIVNAGWNFTSENMSILASVQLRGSREATQP